MIGKKEGRSIASNGYVLIRVGVNHHLADVRGYAYEHRLVAEEKLKRRLLPGEQVHHIDGDKAHNDPENLQVTESLAHHRVYHRTSGNRRRLPDESNPIIQCACGCGNTLAKYDDNGRPRIYISGHNPQPSPTATFILHALIDGPKSISELAAMRPSISKIAIKVCLSKLNRSNRVCNIAKGIWAKNGE